MKRFNKHNFFGILFSSIYLFSIRFGVLPDIIEGFCIGIGLVFILIGMYDYNHGISKFRKYKMNLFKRCFGK